MMNRKEFIKNSLAFGAGCFLFPSACNFTRNSSNKKVLTLGIDGMDVRLTQQYLKQGIMPNLQKLINRGSLKSAQTSMPPQSPVAWSSFSVGASSKVHGIYDFIHRDPATIIPYLSSSKVLPPKMTVKLGPYKIPLVKGEVKLLRKGKPFWEHLAEKDIPSTIFKMPANFPCSDNSADMVSGMGTPDLRGGYGIYTLYTTAPHKFKNNLTGGELIPVAFNQNRMDAFLFGPANTLNEKQPRTRIPFAVWKDKTNDVLRIKIQGTELLIKKGEWSKWVELSFPMIGSLINISGICKIFIKEISPHFSMYITPINIDPSEPALPVVSSNDYAQELVRNVGPFYTQGLPYNTKALSEGILTDDEYFTMVKQIYRERSRLLDFELERFQKLTQGMLFFYVASIDQNTHMLWRFIDKNHPLFDKNMQKRYGNKLAELYSHADNMIGRVMQKYDINDPNFTLIVMSDHGFAPFSRQVNLNNWLYKNGYMALKNKNNLETGEFFSNVQWEKTAAYNLGINCIYINLKGREETGTVEENDRQKLINDIKQKLLKLIDYKTGENAVTAVHIVPDNERILHPHAPDIIVGWNSGYRTSWKSILGGFSSQIFEDNLDKWSGDHCIDPEKVPAILASNRKITKNNPGLMDITATILREFNIAPNKKMEGSSLFKG